MSKRIYPKELRIDARYNCVVRGMTDAECAEDLKLYDQNDRPNYRLIERWRRQSREVDGKYISENWDKFRREHEAQQEEIRKVAWEKEQSEKLSEMVNHAEEFRSKKIKTLNYLMGMIVREVMPKLDPKNPNGPSSVKPDFNLLKNLKIASEAFKINADSFSEMLAEFFMANAPEDDKKSEWAALLETRYADIDISLEDPAMSAEFYQLDGDEWSQKYLEQAPGEAG